MASVAAGSAGPTPAERRQRLNCSSPPKSPFAPHLTVTGCDSSSNFHEATHAQGVRNGRFSSPELPRSDNIAADISGSATFPVSGSRTASHIPSSRASASSSTSSKQERLKTKETPKSTPSAVAILVIEPERSKCNRDVIVEPGAAVRWIHGTPVKVAAGGETAEPAHSVIDDHYEPDVCRGWRDSRRPMTITVVSDALDAPVTRQIEPDGSFAELVFDRPGHYRYHVCSGPVTTGCVVVGDASGVAVTDFHSVSTSHQKSSCAFERGKKAVVESSATVVDELKSSVAPVESSNYGACVETDTERSQPVGEGGLAEFLLGEDSLASAKQDGDASLHRDVIIVNDMHLGSNVGKESPTIIKEHEIITRAEKNNVPPSPSSVRDGDTQMDADTRASDDKLREASWRDPALVQLDEESMTERVPLHQPISKLEHSGAPQLPCLGDRTARVHSPRSANEDDDEFPLAGTPSEGNGEVCESRRGCEEEEQRENSSAISPLCGKYVGSRCGVPREDLSIASTNSGECLRQPDVFPLECAAASSEDEGVTMVEAKVVVERLSGKVDAVRPYEEHRKGWSMDSESNAIDGSFSLDVSQSSSSSFDDDDDDEDGRNAESITAQSGGGLVSGCLGGNGYVSLGMCEVTDCRESTIEEGHLPPPPLPVIPCSDRGSASLNGRLDEAAQATADAEGYGVLARGMGKDAVPPPVGANVGGEPVTPLVVPQRTQGFECALNMPIQTDAEIVNNEIEAEAVAPASPLLASPPSIRLTQRVSVFSRDGNADDDGLKGGSEHGSVDSDDIPSGSWLDRLGESCGEGVRGVDTEGAAVSEIEAPGSRLSSPMDALSPSSPSVPLSTSMVGVVSREESSSPCLAKTDPRPTPPDSGGTPPRKQRVEVLQRNGSGQEWQEVSPLMSPASPGATVADCEAFSWANTDHDALQPTEPVADDDNGTRSDPRTDFADAVVDKIDGKPHCGTHGKQDRIGSSVAASGAMDTTAAYGEGLEEMMRTVDGKPHCGTDGEQGRIGSSVAASGAMDATAADGEGLEESMRTAMDDSPNYGKEEVMKAPKSPSLSRTPSGSAAAAATAAGIAAASSTTRDPEGSSFLVRGNGGTAPASPAEEDPRCRAWSDHDCGQSLEYDDDGDLQAPHSCGASEGVTCSPGRKDSELKGGGESVGNDMRVVLFDAHSVPGQSAFDPEMLTASVGTRVRWERRGGAERIGPAGASSGSQSAGCETFKGMVYVEGDGEEENADNWKVAFSFSLSAAQQTFIHTFSREGRYVVSSEQSSKLINGEACVCQEGQVLIERTTDICDSDSFASSKGDCGGGGSSASFDDDTDMYVGGEHERSSSSDSFAPPSRPSSPLLQQKQESTWLLSDLGEGDGTIQNFGAEDAVISLGASHALKGKDSGGAAVYSSSGVSTQESVVPAPTAAPSVAVLSATIAEPTLECMKDERMPCLLRRRRTLPPISAMLGSGGLGRDRTESGAEKELYGRSGWLLHADRHAALGGRRKIDGCSTATTETEDFWGVARGKGGALAHMGVSASTRSLSYDADCFSASSFSEGVRRDKSRPYDVDDDEEDTDDSDDAVVVDLNNIVFDGCGDASGANGGRLGENRVDILEDSEAASSSVSSFLSFRRRRTDVNAESGRNDVDDSECAAAKIKIKAAFARRGNDDRSGRGLCRDNNAAPAAGPFPVLGTKMMIQCSAGEEGLVNLDSVSCDDDNSEEGGVRVGAPASESTRKRKNNAKKKKKKKKKKRKARAVAAGQNEAGDFDRIGWVNEVDPCDLEREQLWDYAPALLQAAGAYNRSLTQKKDGRGFEDERDGPINENSEARAKVGKTLIARDQGFKPQKPFTVQVGAVVSINKTTLPHSAASYRPRAISVVGPMEVLPASSLFVDGSNRFEDLPRRGSRSVQLRHGGSDMEAVFLQPGEYFLVDHVASKRIKVTANAGEPLQRLSTAFTSSGTEGSTQSAVVHGGGRGEHREIDGVAEEDVGVLNSQPVIDHSGGRQMMGAVSSTSRSKKRKKRKAQTGLAAATASNPSATVATATFCPTKTVPNVERTSGTAGSDGVKDGGKLYEKEEEGEILYAVVASAAEVEAEVGSQDTVEQGSPSLPVAVFRIEQSLTAGARKEYEAVGAIGKVQVSYQRGFEPDVLEVTYAPTCGALVVCELHRAERVTREIVCFREVARPSKDSIPAGGHERSLPSETGIGSTIVEDLAQLSSKKQEKTVAVGAERGVVGRSCVRAAYAGEMGDGGEKKLFEVGSQRLGPGDLRVCHFVLAPTGNYRLAYRDNVDVGVDVVVRSSDYAISTRSGRRKSPCRNIEPASANDAYGSVAATPDASASTEIPVFEESPMADLTREKQDLGDDDDSSRDAASIQISDGRGSISQTGSVQTSSAGAEVSNPKAAFSLEDPSAATQSRHDFAGIVEGQTTNPRASVSSDKKTFGDPRHGENSDEDGAFVQQRSHMKRSRRQQRSTARKNNVREAESAKAAAAAAALVAAEAEAAETAAAIEAVNALIAAEQEAAAAEPSAAKQATIDESLKRRGVAIPEEEEGTMAGPYSAPITVPVNGPTPSKRQFDSKGNGTQPQRASRSVMPVTSNGEGQKNPKVAVMRSGKRFSSSENLTTDNAATIAYGNTEESNGPKRTGEDHQRRNRPAAAAGGKQPAWHTAVAAGPRVSGWGEPVVGASWTEESSAAAAAPESGGALDLPLRRDPGGPCAAGDAAQSRFRILSKGKPVPRGLTGWRVPPAAVFTRNQASVPMVRPLASPANARWGDTVKFVPKSGGTQNADLNVMLQGREPPPAGPAGNDVAGAPDATVTPRGVERAWSNPREKTHRRAVDQGRASSASHIATRSNSHWKSSPTSRSHGGEATGLTGTAATPVATVAKVDDLPRPSSNVRVSTTVVNNSGGKSSEIANEAGTQGEPNPEPNAVLRSPPVVATVAVENGSGGRRVGFPANSTRFSNVEQHDISFGDFGATPSNEPEEVGIDTTPGVGASAPKPSRLKIIFSSKRGAGVPVTAVGGTGAEEAVGGDRLSLQSDARGDDITINYSIIAAKSSASSRTASLPPTAPHGNHGDDHDVIARSASTPNPDSDTPRWGNCSTKVSYEERARRSKELDGAIDGQPPTASGYRSSSRGPRPSDFPEGSRLPSGGFSAPETQGDRLPPASKFEKVEAARMMRLYHTMMKRLREGGSDERLPNGHVPMIHDLAKVDTD